MAYSFRILKIKFTKQLQHFQDADDLSFEKCKPKAGKYIKNGKYKTTQTVLGIYISIMKTAGEVQDKLASTRLA